MPISDSEVKWSQVPRIGILEQLYIPASASLADSEPQAASPHVARSSRTRKSAKAAAPGAEPISIATKLP